MSNIIDYLKWRGDITFKLSEYNEIDSLILARVSYLPFEKLLKENEVITLQELGNRFEAKQKTRGKIKVLWPNDEEFLKVVSKTERYKNIKISDFVAVTEKEIEKQFAAITIHMPDGTLYVSYRGTDTTIIGWKEDFNLSFMTHIESQLSAKEYLTHVAKKYPRRKIRIGGHSKGGNIAIYAAAFVKDRIKKRIIEIVNFDGPGFSREIIESDEYNSILSKCKSYVPQSSIIGRCMYHKDRFIIVESVAKGIYQHDIYSWQLVGTKFNLIESMTNESDFIDNTVTTWLEGVEPERRAKVIDTIFELFFQTKATTFVEMKKNWFESAKAIATTYSGLDKETKQIINNTLNELVSVAKSNIVPEKRKLQIIKNKEEQRK